MRRLRRRLCLLVTAVVLPGCYSYQRDPHYALARFAEILRHPLHRDNLKYTAVVCVVLVVLVATGALLVHSARRHDGGSSREG